MNIGKKNKNGIAISLSANEAKDLQASLPVTKLSVTRKGIVQIEVRQEIVCPSADTRAFLRDVMAGKSHLRQFMVGLDAKTGDNPPTVGQVLDTLGEGFPIAAHNQVFEDLQRFTMNVDRQVPITDIAKG